MSTTRKTFCRICEAHCGLTVEIGDDGKSHKIKPDGEHPISQGFVCAKGLKFADIASHSERLLYPQMKQADGTFQEATWDEALDSFGSKIRPIIEEYGVHSVALYFGTPMIHHSMGLLTFFQLVRSLGTRNLYTAASQDNASKFMAQKIVHGSDYIMPIPDIENTDFCLLMGTNPVVSQGTLIHVPQGTKTYDNLLKRGGEIVIIDPRESESAKRWGGHIRINLGTDIYLLLAIIHELRDLTPSDAILGLEEWLSLAEHYPVARVAEITAIPENRIHELAKKMREADKSLIFTAVGINQGGFGTLTVIASQVIAYLTGNFDSEGGLLFNDWARLLHILVDPKAQKSRIGDYNCASAGLPCGILADEILTEGEGQIKALIVMGGNPLTSVPDENRLREAVESLELILCIDIFQNQTGQMADILLPGLTWIERFDITAWDAMYESAPMLQSSAPVQKPPRECRNEVQILADLSIMSGKPIFGSSLLAKIWGNMNHDAWMPQIIKPLQWLFRKRIQASEAIPWKQAKPGLYQGKRGKKLRFWDAVLDSEIERLQIFASDLSQETETFLLMGRRRRLAQNSWIHDAGRVIKEKDTMAWLRSDDMLALNLQNGDKIVIKSEVGEIEIAVTANDSLMQGTVIVPHGLPDVNVNKLISSAPEYIEPISGMHQLNGHPVTIWQYQSE